LLDNNSNGNTPTMGEVYCKDDKIQNGTCDYRRSCNKI